MITPSTVPCTDMPQLRAFTGTSSHTDARLVASCVASRRPHCWTQGHRWTLHLLLLSPNTGRVSTGAAKQWPLIWLLVKPRRAGSRSKGLLGLACLLYSNERVTSCSGETRGSMLRIWHSKTIAYHVYEKARDSSSSRPLRIDMWTILIDRNGTSMSLTPSRTRL